MPTMANARQRHLYAGGDPNTIATALRIERERGEDDAENYVERAIALEFMIANALCVAVEEGLTNA